MSARVTWKRYAPGLYVDSTERWVATQDAWDFWSLRVFLGYGPTTSGKLMPDYGSTHYGSGRTFADVKADAAHWGDDYPVRDSDLHLRAILEGRATGTDYGWQA